MPGWKQNHLTKRLNMNVPIIQAPMAGASTPAMAAAVGADAAAAGLDVRWVGVPEACWQRLRQAAALGVGLEAA